MMAGQALAEEQVSGLASVGRPEDLGIIGQPGVAAVLRHRTPLPGFQRWIDGLTPDHLPRGRVVLRPYAVRGAVRALCDAAGTPPGPERELLVDDIADWPTSSRPSRRRLTCDCGSTGSSATPAAGSMSTR